MAARSNAQLVGVCIDCRDADELAHFYSGLLGWEIAATDGEDWRQLRSPSGELGLNIQGEPDYEPPVWPESAGRQQKMLHLEIEVTDLEAAVRSVTGAGGSEAEHQPPDRDPSAIRIMLDPAGHPFCLFLAGE